MSLASSYVKEQQSASRDRARALGLCSGTGKYTVPVPDDRERWQMQHLHRRADFVEFAMQEGKKGFASRNGKPYVHLLHSDERHAESHSLTLADKHQRGREMRDRILEEALTADD
jgi:hypothetical protein